MSETGVNTERRSFTPDRRRYNRPGGVTGGVAGGPPYYEVFDRIAQALERIALVQEQRQQEQRQSAERSFSGPAPRRPS
ncbi:MAG: hypothetical protein JWN17_1828 [Frankiales bacterium]|nr:hypothetical protein [Frankiales bacterium]